MSTQRPRALERSLPRAAYWEPAFFARECRAIFWDQWFAAGRAATLGRPGAYCVLDIAGESIIVVRGNDGALHAHFNLCRHRGSRLLCGSGDVRGAIRCPYHGWSYALDGTLVASPFIDRADIPEDAAHLYPAAIAEWGGFFFVRVNDDGTGAADERLLAQLAPIPARLARYPLDAVRSGTMLRYDVAANWKVILENYNECYHCAGVHPELCRIVPAFKSRGGANLDWERGIPHRDGAYTFTATGTTARAPFAGLNDDERVRHKGELAYPNLMLSLSADHVAAFTLWPVAPDRTEIVCDLLFHRDEMNRPQFDPSDAQAFWDIVNRQDWAICERVQQGMRSQRFTRGYYAPMEDASLDIRRYIAARLGAGAIADD